MALGNPNFDALLSSTLANYREEYVDLVSRSFFLLYWLTSKDKKRFEDGGESIVVQLMYGKNSTVKSYSGYETLDTTPQEGLTAVKFPWKQVAGSVSISRLEERQNSGESRLINLLESKVKQCRITMSDVLNEMFYGDGTGNDSKDIFGLALLCEPGVWGTLGGIDASLTMNSFWRNKAQNHNSAGFGTSDLLQATMRTGYNSASRGNEHPDFAVTTQTIYEKYEAGLVPNERFEDKSTGDAGFTNLKFKGLVLGYDEQCPANLLYMLNSNYLEFVVDKETDLITSDFVRPENQDARTSQLLLMANLTVSNRARQLVCYNVV